MQIILVGRANEVCKPRTILCVSLKIAAELSKMTDVFMILLNFEQGGLNFGSHESNFHKGMISSKSIMCFFNKFKIM
jgi:hypothetical protein